MTSMIFFEVFFFIAADVAHITAVVSHLSNEINFNKTFICIQIMDKSCSKHNKLSWTARLKAFYPMSLLQG